MRLLNLVKLVLDNGWVIDGVSLPEIFEVAGISELQRVLKEENFKISDIVHIKKDMKWRKIFVAVETGKEFSNLLGIPMPQLLIQ